MRYHYKKTYEKSAAFFRARPRLIALLFLLNRILTLFFALAYKDGLKNAKPVLLEPVHRLKIAVPSDYLGDVMGDVNKRRGRIMGTDTEGESSVITAEIPLAEIMEYTMELRSLTRGSGKFVSEFLGYEEVPFALVDKIIAAAQKN